MHGNPSTTQEGDRPLVVLMIRHGDYQQWEEPAKDKKLTPCGQNQAERVARALDIMPERPPVKRIVSSTMVRAQQTAAIVCAKLAIEFQTDEALEEGTPDPQMRHIIDRFDRAY